MQLAINDIIQITTAELLLKLKLPGTITFDLTDIFEQDADNDGELMIDYDVNTVDDIEELKDKIQDLKNQAIELSKIYFLRDYVSLDIEEAFKEETLEEEVNNIEEYEDIEHYAENILEELYSIPDNILPYIDLKHFGKDILVDYYWTDDFGKLYIYNN